MTAAQSYTEKELKALERRIASVYREAGKTVKERYKKATEKIAEKDAKKREQLKNGEITKAEYDQWKKGALLHSQIGKDMVKTIASDYKNADKITYGLINETNIDIYAFNANYAAYEIEAGIGANLTFSLYDHKAVENLLKNPESDLFPVPDPAKIDKADIWNRKKITSAMAQGIVAGDSIPHIADRLQAVTNMDRNTAIRNARTYTTAVENKAKLDRYQEAEQLGLNCNKIWHSAHDARVRESHRWLDQEQQPLDKPFSNGLMFCGDVSSGKPEEYCNCRCRIVSVVVKYDKGVSEEWKKSIQGIDYDEWKFGKEHPEYNKAKYNVQKAKGDIDYIDKGQKFSGLWKDDKNLKDYDALKAGGNITAKEAYFDDQIAKYQKIVKDDPSDSLAQSKLAEMQDKKALLEDFKAQGEQYLTAKANLDKWEGELKPLETQFGKKVSPKSKNLDPFSFDAYSADRKNKALWTSDKKEVDRAMRDRTGEIWRAATEKEKDAVYEYTRSYSKYNEPLRGIEYGTNRYLGVGNTDLNAGSRNNGENLNNMTSIIDKCSYDHDMWMQRGVGINGMDKFFACSEDLLRNGTVSELENELLGKTVTEYGFMSCGSAKGEGFSGNIIMNIYAPKGTNMIYAEPFSHYGYGDKRSWNGYSEQTSLGTEFETILQQGTQFRISRVEKNNGTIYVDLDVIGRNPPQLYKK